MCLTRAAAANASNIQAFTEPPPLPPPPPATLELTLPLLELLPPELLELDEPLDELELPLPDEEEPAPAAAAPVPVNAIVWAVELTEVLRLKAADRAPVDCGVKMKV